MLRGTTQLAYALAEDQLKLLESKVGTLSLVLRRIYSAEGDAGLRRYFTDISQVKDLLEFASCLNLATPMVFPRRTASSSVHVETDAYEWGSSFDDTEVGEYFEQLRMPPSVESTETQMETDPPAPPPATTDLHSHREPSPVVPRKRVRIVSPASEEAGATSGGEDESSSGEDDSDSEPAPIVKVPRRKTIQAPLVTYSKDRHPLAGVAGTSAKPQPVPRPPTQLEKKKLEKIVQQAKKPRRK